MTGARGSTAGTGKTYWATVQLLRAEHWPRGLAGRRAVAADRAIATRAARVDIADALPVVGLPHAVDRGAELGADLIEIVIAGLPSFRVLVDLGLQILV